LICVEKKNKKIQKKKKDRMPTLEVDQDCMTHWRTMKTYIIQQDIWNAIATFTADVVRSRRIEETATGQRQTVWLDSKKGLRYTLTEESNPFA
jgi:hypothetical protein